MLIMFVIGGATRQEVSRAALKGDGRELKDRIIVPGRATADIDGPRIASRREATQGAAKSMSTETSLNISLKELFHNDCIASIARPLRE